MGWFQKLSAGLSKTRNAVTGQLDRLLGRAADPALLDELEIALISADLGLPVVERVMEQLRAQMRGGNFSSAEKVRELLRQSVLDILLPTQSVSMNQLVAQGPYLDGRSPCGIRHFTQFAFDDYAARRGSVELFCAVSGPASHSFT